MATKKKVKQNDWTRRLALAPEYADALERIAEEEDRSLAYLIRQAVMNLVDNHGGNRSS